MKDILSWPCKNNTQHLGHKSQSPLSTWRTGGYVCSIQCGGSNWDIHCCPIHNKRQFTDITVHSIHNHRILLVQIHPQLHHIFLAAIAILACADLAIPLCACDRVLPHCRDSLLVWTLQDSCLLLWRPLPVICSCWSCVYYWKRVGPCRAPALLDVSLPFGGSTWRQGEIKREVCRSEERWMLRYLIAIHFFQITFDRSDLVTLLVYVFWLWLHNCT